jgi:hypothetical protein
MAWGVRKSPGFDFWAWGACLGVALSASCSGAPRAAPAAAAPSAKRSISVERSPASCGEAAQNIAAQNMAARRLSVTQYENALADLFSNKAFSAMLEELGRSLRQLPRDGESGASFPDMDARIGARHVGAYVQVADEVADGILKDTARLSALAGSCALAAALDRDCLRRFAKEFGHRVYRRPLAEAEIQTWVSRAALGADGPAAYGVLTAGLLASAEFWLRRERSSPDSDDSDAADDGAPHHLAERLALHFWRTTPDDRLLAAARSGELARVAGYRAQVERLSRHQRGRATWYAFFRQWLGLEDFPGFAKDPALERLAGSTKVTPELYDDAVWEIEELVGHYTFDARGSYADLLTSTDILTRSQRLAALYGVTPWDGHSRPAQFAPGERSGVLSRAALLMSGGHDTNPFARGAFVRRQLLCETIEPPAQRPPDAFVLPPFDPKATTRVRYESKVSSPSCKSCHDLFSPYGYALEAYDALGRHRSQERLIDDAGGQLGTLPLSTSVRVWLDLETPREVEGPVELAAALAESPIARACMARQYFRFTFQRRETDADACTISELTQALEERGLYALYRDVALTSAFTQGAVSP